MAPPSTTGGGSRAERRQAALRRRRQAAAARSAAARRAALRRRRLQALAGFAVVAVAAAIVVAVLALRGGNAPSTHLRAALVKGATDPVGISASPATWSATYKSESYSGSKATVTTEEVSIRRPFDGRVVIKEGAPPGHNIQFEGRSGFAVYANYTEAGSPQVAGDAPTVALGDLRLDNSVDDLVEQGLFQPRERRRALGRDCQVFRTGSPLQTLKLTKPAAKDYTDACLDDAGLLLEEVTVAGGKATQHLTATRLDREVTPDPALFTIDGPRVGPDQGGSDVTQIDPTVAPVPGYWALDGPPAGFAYRGRYLVAGAQSTYVDVYVRGVDMFTVRQGAPAAEPELTDAPEGKDADLGALGAGKVVLGSVGPTVVAHPGSDAFVHVAGTLAPSQLQTIAAGLHQL